MPDSKKLLEAYHQARARLLAERTAQGHWVGELSASALSTATACMALFQVQHQGGQRVHSAHIEAGLDWLARHQNADGGWGDTTRSFSNISTTMLCRSAFYLTGNRERFAANLELAEAWLGQHYGPPAAWPEAIRRRYGKDRTFATPILTTCALAGLVSWREVPPLPFELAVLPQSWFRLVRLHVVSYALPALIAIGQVIHHRRKTWNPLTWTLRRLSRSRTLRVLRAIQPSSGGYLEATPLTSFVTLSLASIGLANHPVAKSAVEFLVHSARPDGSWAIDSNLATWLTTLSINALSHAESPTEFRDGHLYTWLLDQQGQVQHPFTGAAPGAWGWTDLPGSVPDADDTPGALLALWNLNHDRLTTISACLKKVIGRVKLLKADDVVTLDPAEEAEARTMSAVVNGLTWLLNLQNRDGGWPTFCRGWTQLPFDRSGADLTAHVLRALAAWLPTIREGWCANAFSDQLAPIRFRGGELQGTIPGIYAIERAIDRGLQYLERAQRADGSWLPLWFGNQHTPDDENPTYGTAKVLAAYRDLGRLDTPAAQRGIRWLIENQNTDGGWGGGRGSPSSLEESALALEALLDIGEAASLACSRGLDWLIAAIDSGMLDHATPIGFYFAKLWYYEKLYPIIFATAALGRALRSCQPMS